MKTTRVHAAVLLSLLSAAPAYGADGWYLSVEGGAGIVNDWEHTRTLWTLCGPEFRDAVASFDTGWAVFGAGGYALDNWRIEFEGGYRHNELDSYLKEKWNGTLVSVNGRGPAPTGELSEASLMLNILYDVPLFDRFSMSIGLGVGADYARLKFDTGWAPVDEENWHFAYQGIAGLNYAITGAMIVFVNYRYANVNDARYEPTPAIDLEGEAFEKQTASAGIRFALSAPDAPVPVPQPPATPAPVPLEREFMVFFGFNRANLTPQALATIRQAVTAVRESGSAAIRVVGHTDRVGSIAYNKVLSVRRATSVQKALVAEGIAADSISISGRGESEPMVPTADGVRESQNRRVHISF